MTARIVPPPSPFPLACIIETENASGRSILRGIGRYICEERTCRMYYIRPDTMAHSHWIKELKTWDRGAVIARVSTPEMVSNLREIGLPAIDIGYQLLGTGLPVVKADNQAIGHLAAQHLLELGFRRLGF